MLELIRKHQYGIMVLVAVIVIFAFAWWGDFFGRGEQNPGRGQPFISFGGKTYTQAQISKVASGYQVAQRHFPFHVFQVERAYRKYELSGLDYALNTMALRKHAVDYGIAVSPEEIDKRMLSMPDFQTPEARQRMYRIYGSLGLGEADVAQIVADVITMEKLSDLVSAGLLASDAGAEFDYASRYQTIFSSVATIPDVKPEGVEVTDEELKELYEAQKAALNTERQVAIRYVFFEAPSEKAPKKPESPSGEKGKPKDPETKSDTDPEGEPKPAVPEKDGEIKSGGEPVETPGEKESIPEKKETKETPNDPAAEGNPEANCGDEDGAIQESEEKDASAGNSGEAAPEGTDPAEPDAEVTGTEKTEADDPSAEAKPDESTKPEVPEVPEVSVKEGKEADGSKDPPAANEEGTKPPVSVPGIEIPKIDIPEFEEEISIEERTRLRKEFNALVDQFWGEFFKEGEFVPGVDFAEKAKDKQYGVKIVETGLFSESNPPEDIADQSELINAAVAKSLDPPISDPIPATGDKKGYYIFEILKVEEPRQKTFEESKQDLEKALRRDKAAEATLVAADEAREKIVAAMKAGKSFAEAVTEAGLKAEELKPFSPSEPPAEPVYLRQMMPALMATVPGEISEVVDLFDGKGLVFVEKRELWKRANAETLKDSVRSGAVSSQGFSLLGEWFAKVRNLWNEKIL